LLITLVIHAVAKPSFKIPPGSIVVLAAPIVDSGVIAASPGGLVEATKSWVMPGYDRPTMPTWLCMTQGWAATVSITS
jgi:hypothetical protein